MAKLVIAETLNPCSVLRIKLQHEHGDADATTYTTSNVKFSDGQSRVDVIQTIIDGINRGLELIDEDSWGSPFLFNEEVDWNETNINTETGTPLIGAQLLFDCDDGGCPEYAIGTVVDVNEDDGILVLEHDGVKYKKEIDSIDQYAPANAIVIEVDGYQIEFTVDGMKVHAEGEGDCTADGQFAARSFIAEVQYFDENGIQFNVVDF